MSVLSNTAIPKYYGEFRAAVLNGEIVVNEEISLEMNRIDALIDNPKVYYDPAPVEGYISCSENEMVLTDGGDLHLLPSFKLWAEQIYGWYVFFDKNIYVPNVTGSHYGGHYEMKSQKKRLTRKQYLIVARGAAKTIYSSTIHSYELNINTQTTHQICTAPTMKQAEETMSPIKTAILKSKGPLFKFLTKGSIRNTSGDTFNRPKLLSTNEGILNTLTNSKLEIKPMAIDKLQGLRVRVASVDEWLSGNVREDPIGAIEQGASKFDDYLILATSSEGTVRNGIGDSIKMELEAILRGEYYAPHVSIFYYKLDDVSEIANPDLWVKANPNIGHIVSYETYQEEVERAEKAPASRNDILAKRFGIPLKGFTYFFTFEECELFNKQSFWGCSCAMGADLSQGDDFCAFTFLFPLPNGAFGVKSRCYITEDTLMKLPLAMYQKYQEFINEGTLCIFEGVMLDIEVVYSDLIKFIDDNDYDVCCMGYDPYNAKTFVKLWTGDYGEYSVEKVIQGAKTESVPLGETKKLVTNRMLIFDELIFQFTMENSIVVLDSNNNKKLSKDRAERKIDCVAAEIDALVAYKKFKDTVF